MNKHHQVQPAIVLVLLQKITEISGKKTKQNKKKTQMKIIWLILNEIPHGSLPHP